MKKSLLILFSFFYLLSSAGVVLNLHYCGGKVKSISLVHTDESGCCKDKMPKKGCCKEKSAFVKIKDSQSASKALQLPVHQVLYVPGSSETAVSCNILSPLRFAALNGEPPGPYRNPAYLRHRALLI